MAQQRHHEAHRFRRGPQAIEGRAFRALNVLRHAIQIKRLSLHEWMPMLPWRFVL